MGDAPRKSEDSLLDEWANVKHATRRQIPNFTRSTFQKYESYRYNEPLKRVSSLRSNIPTRIVNADLQSLKKASRPSFLAEDEDDVLSKRDYAHYPRRKFDCNSILFENRGKRKTEERSMSVVASMKSKLEDLAVKRRLNEEQILKDIKKRIDEDVEDGFGFSDISSLEPVPSASSIDTDLSWYSIRPCPHNFPVMHTSLPAKVETANVIVDSGDSREGDLDVATVDESKYRRLKDQNFVENQEVERTSSLNTKSSQSVDSGVLMDFPSNETLASTRKDDKNTEVDNCQKVDELRRDIYESDVSFSDEAGAALKVESAVRRYTEELILCERRAMNRVKSKTVERPEQGRKKKIFRRVRIRS